MTSLDEVPFKIPPGCLEEAKQEVELVTAPEITLPDYLTILQETEYEYSLENWVLTGLQGGYPPQPPSPAPRSPSEVLPSCPPYWMMFSSPQESRLANRYISDFWEPNPRLRSHSLNLAEQRAKVKFLISDSEDEGEGHSESEGGGDRSSSGSGSVCGGGSGSGPRPRQRLLKDLRQPQLSSPNLLNLPGCGPPPSGLAPHQRRKNLRQSSLSVLETSRGGGRSRTPMPPSSSSHRLLQTRAHTIERIPTVTHHKSTHPTVPDASDELLSALSSEERDLLAAITEKGYPLRTAIIALQKTGQQSPEKILSYLEACDRLCELGHDEAQVEEALEMFQNCETKAEEFLHLLSQFNEMGFQPNAIKEVLLVHENHRDRALEELMTRVA